MPCYNAGPYVGAAIASILGQTWQNLEVIVVDDGSTDESLEAIGRFSSDARLRVIEQDNRGQCAAANRALQEARGAFIKFVDADDVLSSEFIEHQMTRLAGRRDAVASAEWGRFHQDDLGTFRKNPQSVWRDMKATDWLVEAWMDARPMMQCALWLIPREVLDRCGGWDERLSLINDFEFFARVLCHAEDVLFTPGAVLHYRSGVAGSLSGRRSRAAVESAYHALLAGTGHLLARRSDPAARRACANLLQDFDHTYYPDHPDLRRTMRDRVRELGGSDLPPDGPPRFQALRRLVGWKLARRVQRALGR